MSETLEEEIKRLKGEIQTLKDAVKTLTEALKLLTEKDERAKTFISRVEELLDSNLAVKQLENKLDEGLSAL